MSTYRRSHVDGATYFFTVISYERRRILCKPDVRTALGDALRTVRSIHPFSIDAIVLLPDHLHCIWTLPLGDAGYGVRWSLIKAAVSKRCAARLFAPATSESRLQRGESGLWQRRFWEHLIRDDEDRARHVDYIHWNPVKHSYVAKPADWEYSSFRRFVEAGVYPADWGIADGVDDGEFGE